MNRLIISISILLLLGLSGAAFYWYEWRPQQIVKACNEDARGKAREAENDKRGIYQQAFELCIRSRGLE